MQNRGMKCLVFLSVMSLMAWLAAADCHDEKERMEARGLQESGLPFCEEDGTYSKVQCLGFL